MKHRLLPRRAVAALLAAVLLPTAGLFALTATPSTTEGPYYTFNSGQTLDTSWITGEAADNDLTHIYATSAQSSGTLFLLSGTLVNTSGTPLAGATIELWHADNGGTYYYGNAAGNNIANRDTKFQSYGTCVTDASGNWSFRTIKPGLYTGRIRHFHFTVRINGTARLTSQFMFAEDSALYASDNVASGLVSAGTMSLVTLSPTSGTDSSGATALIAAKQIVVNATATGSTGTTTTTGGTTTTVVAPAISASPASKTATVGDTVTFTVTATGTAPFTYQWSKNGAAISGATAATYTIASVAMADAASYTAAVTNASGTVTSSAATLTVTSAADTASAALVNLSVRSYFSSSNTVLTAGFVVQSAGGKRLLVRAVGPTLSQFGIGNAMADPRLEVYDASSASMGANDNWNSALSSTFTSLGAFALPAGSKDAAMMITLPSGAGTAQVRGTGAGVALVEAYDTGATSTSRIVNLSARTLVGAGDNVLVAGFVLSGTGSKRLLIRGIGPQLTRLGVPGALADPILEIYNGSGVKVAESDNWAAALATAFTNAGAFALTTGSKDAALLVTLPAGASYSTVLRSADTTTGEALLELYDLP